MIWLPRAIGKYRGRRGRDQEGHATAVFCGIVNQGVIPACENILAEELGQLRAAGRSWDGWSSCGRTSEKVEKHMNSRPFLSLLSVFQHIRSHTQITIAI